MARRTCVHLIGGHGGLTDRYREVAATYGAELLQYEEDAPAALGERAVLVVCQSHSSHGQRAIGLRLAARYGLDLLEMRTQSTSSLRAVLDPLPLCTWSQHRAVWDAAHELARASEVDFVRLLRNVRESAHGLWGECRGCHSTLMMAAARRAPRVTVAGVRL